MNNNENYEQLDRICVSFKFELNTLGMVNDPREEWMSCMSTKKNPFDGPCQCSADPLHAINT